MSVPHPIPYQGSKRALAKRIIALFPPDADRLIEPFAGSAAVALAAAYRGKITHVVLNDLNAPLIALWDAIINTPEQISDDYEVLWTAQLGREREYYDWVRDQFNATHRPDYFLYLLARCVKAAVRYNANGDFNQSPDNRRKGARPATMRRHILGASQLLKDKAALRAVDYREVLDMATSSAIVYMDPPYQGVTNNRDPRYIDGIGFEDFVEALSVLNKRQISFIVSYDGRTGQKVFGPSLPECLNLYLIELDAGRSSQATLLGRQDRTVESLYLSPALVDRLAQVEQTFSGGAAQSPARQLVLFS